MARTRRFVRRTQRMRRVWDYQAFAAAGILGNTLTTKTLLVAGTSTGQDSTLARIVGTVVITPDTYDTSPPAGTWQFLYWGIYTAPLQGGSSIAFDPALASDAGQKVWLHWRSFVNLPQQMYANQPSFHMPVDITVKRKLTESSLVLAFNTLSGNYSYSYDLRILTLVQ